jgi:cytochrome P450
MPSSATACPQARTCFLVPFVIHRHPEFWPNPEAFDPRSVPPGGLKDAAA